MDTTAGAYALVGIEAKGNCPVVQRLLDAGMVILGKTNLTVRITSLPPSLLITQREGKKGELLKKRVGIRWNENPRHDARLVCSSRTDHLAICWADCRRGAVAWSFGTFTLP